MKIKRVGTTWVMGIAAIGWLASGAFAAKPSVPPVDSIITLKAVNGKYVSAIDGDDSTLIANQTLVSNYERFRVVKAFDSIALQCIGNNKFVSIERLNGSKPMVASRTKIGKMETFKWVPSGKQIALCSVRTTNYVSVFSNGIAYIHASQPDIGSYEKFTWKVE